jgi:concanavalin A-like lectin/glucanase superfamily protein
VTVEGIDLAAPPENPVVVTLIAPQGRWRHAAAWRSAGRGDLRWTGAPARTPRAASASPAANSPFETTTGRVDGKDVPVLRERATGRTWRFDAATGRWIEVVREGSLGEGLVASLPLASDLSDAGGRAAAVSAGGVTFEGGEARFDGTGWIELPHIALDRRAHAFSMWIKPEGDSKVMGLVEQRDSDAGNHHYHLMLRGNSQPYLGFYMNDLAAPDALTHGEEHHLVFQYTGTKQQIWVDGALVAERASSAYEGTTGETRIGRNPSWTNVGGTHFVGAMRNVRVYGRALSPAEIAEIRRREGRKDAAPAKALLVFDGPIDGSDRVVITQKEARWENVFWGTWRETVTLNGVPWKPRENPVLPNSGATRFLPPGVDLTKARLVERSGRDHASIEVEGGRLVLRFVDSPNGIDRYRVVVAFD